MAPTRAFHHTQTVAATLTHRPQLTRRPEVHAVFVCVPGVVQHSDGGFTYGQPAAQGGFYGGAQQEGYYAPPVINRPPHAGAAV